MWPCHGHFQPHKRLRLLDWIVQLAIIDHKDVLIKKLGMSCKIDQRSQ